MSDDAAFLNHMALMASCEPCELLQADLLRLLMLAGLGRETHAYQEVQGQGERLLVLREGALELIRLARERFVSER